MDSKNQRITQKTNASTHTLKGGFIMQSPQYKYFFIVVGMLCQNLLCSNDTNHWLDKAKSVATSVSAGWATVLGSVITHEVGHIATGKALAPRAVKGGSMTMEISRGLPRGSFALTFEPRAWSRMSRPYKSFLLFTTYASGPLAGLAASYAALRLSNIYAEKKKEPLGTYAQAWQKSKEKSILNKEQNIGVQVGALYATVRNVLSIMPYKKANDGYKMLEAIGKSHLAGGTKSLLSALFMGLAVAGYGGVQIYKARTADKK